MNMFTNYSFSYELFQCLPTQPCHSPPLMTLIAICPHGFLPSPTPHIFHITLYFSLSFFCSLITRTQYPHTSYPQLQRWPNLSPTTPTTTTPPNMIPLTRGLGRSECRQPNPCQYHYSQRSRFQKTHKKVTLQMKHHPVKSNSYRANTTARTC